MQPINYLTMSNYGYIEFLKNAINNYVNILYSNDTSLTIYCLDNPTYIEINKYIQDKTKFNISTKIHDINYIKSTTFNSPEFFKLTNIKFKIILELIKTNIVVHFFDPDVYFFNNPQQIIGEKIRYNDFVFQQDAPRSHGHHIYSNYVCTGNFSIKNSYNSLQMLQILTELSASTGNQNDQEILYNYLNSKTDNIKNYKEASLEIYDPNLFQNGCDAFQFDFHTNDTKICIHANHMTGKDKKISSLKAINAWTIDN